MSGIVCPDCENGPDQCPCNNGISLGGNMNQVVKYPNPVLNIPCKLVTIEDTELVGNLIPEMYKICLNKKRPGVGLAANQIGHSLKLLVMVFKHRYLNLINPEIIEMGEDTSSEYEKCLSFNKNLKYLIKRPNFIKVKHTLLSDIGKAYSEICFSNLEARIIQHEIDHLNGITIFDRWGKQNGHE